MGFQIHRAAGVKNEVDTDAGSKGGKMHYSVRYDYKDVKAPKM